MNKWTNLEKNPKWLEGSVSPQTVFHKLKDTLESEEEKCQRHEISPEASMDFYNAVSGDFMLPVVVTWGSFTRP